MNGQHVRLTDRAQNPLAEGYVVDEGDHFAGTVDLQATPLPIRRLFEEFEEIVNEQALSFLDEIQARIAAVGIRVLFDDGASAPVGDLQVFPGAGEFSFRLGDRMMRTGGEASQADAAPVAATGSIPG